MPPSGGLPEATRSAGARLTLGQDPLTMSVVGFGGKGPAQ